MTEKYLPTLRAWAARHDLDDAQIKSILRVDELIDDALWVLTARDELLAWLDRGNLAPEHLPVQDVFGA